MSKHNYYKTCPDCGANLDPGEICDCNPNNPPFITDTINLGIDWSSGKRISVLSIFHQIGSKTLLVKIFAKIINGDETTWKQTSSMIVKKEDSINLKHFRFIFADGAVEHCEGLSIYCALSTINPSNLNKPIIHWEEEPFLVNIPISQK